jgi:sugar phosphate isomerase/epimerase
MMKISFSTLGCPEWSWEDMLSTAKDLGFDGIEVRGIENEIYVPKAKPFSEAGREATKAKLVRLNLHIPCLTSSCYLFDNRHAEAFLQEGMEYIDLASRLNVPYVRVLGDANPQPGQEICDGLVAENLRKLASYAEGKNVRVLIETNGVFADSGRMQALMKEVNHPGVGVLWDIHHPYRYFNETVEGTYGTLKQYISFIHIKDSVVADGKVRYKMLGHGDVPVREALELLRKNGYSGFVSLEWVKRWCMDLEDPGIVFSQYINFVKDVIRRD